MQIENIARVRFSARRTFQKQAHGAVSDGVLAEIVIYDEHVIAIVHEFLGNSTARIRRDVLKRRASRSRRADYYGIIHRAVLGQRIDDGRHRR